MEIITKSGAQGDFMVRRWREPIPESAKPQTPQSDGAFIVAHSHSGHHHIVKGAKEVLDLDLLKSYIVAETQVEMHHQKVGGHEPFALGIPEGEEGPIVWEVTRQRVAGPDGWTRPVD